MPHALPQIRSVFWIYALVMLALLVAYVLEIISWLILGAVVNPSKWVTVPGAVPEAGRGRLPGLKLMQASRAPGSTALGLW